MPYVVKDVTHALRGLSLPGHMGITPSGRVFVSDFGSGTIHEVTATHGGFAGSQSLVADNLHNPSGIQPISDNLLVLADAGSGTIRELQLDKSSLYVPNTKEIYSGVSNPYGVFMYESELYCTFSNNRMSGLVKVNSGAGFRDGDIYVSDFPVVIQSEPFPELAGCGGSWPGGGTAFGIIYGHYAMGTLFNVTGGGTFDQLREKRLAWGLNGPLGFTEDPVDHEIYVVEKASGVIKRINATHGYSRFALPLIAGFQEPSCIRFLPDGSAAYVCDRAWGTVFKLTLQHHSI